MVTVPAAMPVTTPAVLTVAVVELLVLHVPPVGEAVNVIVEPAQTVLPPVIDAVALTVIV